VGKHFLFNAAAIIHDNDIALGEIAIALFLSNGTIIANNVLRFEDRGIFALRGNSLLISNNSIGFATTETSRIVVYPNPSTGRIFVNFSKDWTGRIELISISGQSVYKETLDQKKTTSFDLNVPKGLYLIKMFPQNGLPFTEKLIISN